MADTKDRYALAKLIDDMVSDAMLAGKSEALKCLGQFTPTEGVTVSVLHRSISQKRAQLIGYFDETATPPSDAAHASGCPHAAKDYDHPCACGVESADAALADDALCESLIEASDMRWNGDVYVGDGADLMNLVRAALRARAVPEAVAKDAARYRLIERHKDFAILYCANATDSPKARFWDELGNRELRQRVDAILSATDSEVKK